MKQPIALLVLAGAAVAALTQSTSAQNASTQTAQTAQTKPAPKHYTPYYLPSALPDYAALLPLPPAPGSVAARQDAAAVLEAQQQRTPVEISAAQKDDAQEDIFLYATVLGPHFKASAFPLTAALSAHLRNDVGVVSPPLKALYHRPRPFLADPAVHPVCEQKSEGSYPSGHASVGYLTGLVLAQMVPEKSAAILARAQEYAGHRILCGVHYPTDTEASRSLALAAFGSLWNSPRFQQDLHAATQEIRAQLALPPAAALQTH